MSDRRGTMSNGHDPMVGPVETMRETANRLRLAAYGPDDEMRIAKDLPKAKPRMIMPVEG